MAPIRANRRRQNNRAVTVPTPGTATDTAKRGKREIRKNTPAGQAKYERSYTRAELFELFTYFHDDPDALGKLADFMGVDKRNEAAAKLLAEFAAIHDAQSLNLEQRGKGR